MTTKGTPPKSKRTPKKPSAQPRAKTPAKPRKPRTNPGTPSTDPENVVSIVRPRRNKPTPGKAGRPHALTEETQEQILGALRAGATRIHAARYGGIHHATFHRWLDRGRKERDRTEAELIAGRIPIPDPIEAPFRTLCDSVEEAEAQVAVLAATTVRSAMQANQVVKVRRVSGTGAARQVIEVTEERPDWGARIRAATWYQERRVAGFQPKEFVAMELGGVNGEPIGILVETADESRQRAREVVDVMLTTGVFEALAHQGEDQDGDDT